MGQSTQVACSNTCNFFLKDNDQKVLSTLVTILLSKSWWNFSSVKYLPFSPFPPQNCCEDLLLPLVLESALVFFDVGKVFFVSSQECQLLNVAVKAGLGCCMCLAVLSPLVILAWPGCRFGCSRTCLACFLGTGCLCLLCTETRACGLAAVGCGTSTVPAECSHGLRVRL